LLGDVGTGGGVCQITKGKSRISGLKTELIGGVPYTAMQKRFERK